MSIENLFSISFSMSFTDINHFSISLSFSYYEISLEISQIIVKGIWKNQIINNNRYFVDIIPNLCCSPACF